MKKLFCSFLFCSALLGSHVSQASVVYFDDLDTVTTPTIQVPDNYAGFVWGSIGNPALTAINDAHYMGVGNYGNSYGSPSGENGVFNSGIVNIALSSGLPFDFNGAYFSPFTAYNNLTWLSSVATSITVEGYNGVNLVGTASMNFLTAEYLWLQADLKGVTKLVLTGSSPVVQPYQTWWLMDNFTYNENNQTIQPVPEPALFWLLGSGLLGLMGFNRKRAQSLTA